MALGTFQIICALVLAAAYALDLRNASERKRRAATIGALIVAAWLGEHSCIELYAFYAYADGWWLRVGHVPLLVPLIWPMVVLSARDIVAALWPACSPLSRALRVGAIVVFDASIMEVIAVGAGYWSWSEGGYLGVPLMGIVGWGCFGFTASLWLERAPGWWLAATPLVTIAGAHVLILASWWGGLRWVLRGQREPMALLGFAVVSVIYSLGVLRSRRRLPWATAGPRMLATSVFVALLVTLEVQHRGLLWAHIGIAAIPYLLMTDWRAPFRRDVHPK